MMTSIVFKSLVYLGVVNTPYPKGLTVIPALLVEHRPVERLYGLVESSARCMPTAIDRFNPITAKWTVEAGYIDSNLRVGVGHTSEHGADSIWPANESFNYLRLEYRMELH